MRVLVGCEESQAVTIELRKLGHEAYSCDTQECSGGYPEWHIQGDLLEQLDKGWDMMIAFPPCTYLSNVGNRWFKPEYNQQYDIFKGLYTRLDKRKEAFDFFMKLVNAPIPLIAIENPKGIPHRWYRKPDQVIQPYYFGDPFKKTTCLWLKGLPTLEETNKLEEPKPLYRTSTKGKTVQWCESLGSGYSKLRSKTFPGIAKAMAEQWAGKANEQVNQKAA